MAVIAICNVPWCRAKGFFFFSLAREGLNTLRRVVKNLSTLRRVLKLLVRRWVGGR
jgi:hypothetical protein